MNTQETKITPIYFYYLSIKKQKNSSDTSIYDISQIASTFKMLLDFICNMELIERKYDVTSSEKMVWLDSFVDLKNGNFNIIFKSAKYNHIRSEIDTETMESLGTRKRQQDGDEEKTHLCIRLSEGQQRFLTVHESNHYGISIKCIADYLNEQFVKYNEEFMDQSHYEVDYEVMPGDDFISALKKAKTISALHLMVSKEALSDQWLRFAGREDISDTIEIVLKRPKGTKKFPDNLIRAYYQDMQENNEIKRIVVKGRKEHGNFEAGTDLVKMKHILNVIATDIKEVDSVDFFAKSQEFINESRN